ncbi:LEA type 2 family protein [Pseudomonas sp. 3A(2025)]
MATPSAMNRTVLIAFLLCGLSGCSSWWSHADWQEPRVRLLKVEAVKVRLLQQDMRLYFEIDNPNDSRLLVRALRYTVVLGDIPLIDDEVRDWFFVAGHSHEMLVVPVRTNLWRYAKPLAERLKHRDQPIPYRLEGKLKTGLLFRDSVRIGLEGEIMPASMTEYPK